MQPRAIETRYQGYRFRSRTEARWAVFFDHLGLPWEYEPEGFELPGGVRYLPDFKIGPFWFEVKPVGGSTEKVKLFASQVDAFVFVLDGPPELQAYLGWHFSDGRLAEENIAFMPGWSKYAPGYTSTGEADRRRFPSGSFPEVLDDLRAAVNAARSARFEHGESGAR